MLLVNTYVAPSAIEGVGVFAGERIEKGAEIWRFDSNFDRLVPEESLVTAPAHLRAFFERYGYPWTETTGMLVVEIDNGRFMNHSEAPNTDFRNPNVGYALREIEAGEEMTCNYADFDPAFELQPARMFLAANGVAAH